jgi:hypothetical protein
MSLVAPVGGSLAHVFRDFHGRNDVWILLLAAVIAVAGAGLGRSSQRTTGDEASLSSRSSRRLSSPVSGSGIMSCG